MKFLLLSLLAMSFVGCTMMSKEDCERADWKDEGYKAAKDGESLDHYRNVKRKCSEFGARINKKQYAKGRKAGLREFCTYNSGYSYGNRGYDYKDICPEKLESKFLKGYNLGKNDYYEEQRQEAIEEALEEIQLEHSMSGEIYDSHNCAHITADGGCAHEL